MYAIVKIGGNQYRVSPGEKVTVDRLTGNVGDTLTFPTLLVVDDAKQVKVGKETTGISVTATIATHEKGDKIDVRRFRHKVRHRRHIGFRPALTTLTIEAIGDKKAPAKVKDPQPKEK